MNIIEGALFTFLQNQSTIAAYVGGAAAVPASVPRIYPLKIRQDSTLEPPAEQPALSYFIVDGASQITLDALQVGKGYKRIQISAWADDILVCKRIVEAIRLLVAGYKGLWDDVDVEVVQFNYGLEIYDHVAKLFHCPIHIVLYHDEATNNP